jgi:glycine cleavage system H protein
MTNYLEVTVDKFIFRVAKDRFYSQEGLWAKTQGNLVRVGLADFVQQRNGDVAFAEVKDEGLELTKEDELAVIETIKVDISFTSPVEGTVVKVNPKLDDSPEIINEDPYGEGWLTDIAPKDWESDKKSLLDAQSYFERMKVEAEEEVKNL